MDPSSKQTVYYYVGLGLVSGMCGGGGGSYGGGEGGSAN